MEPRQYIVTSNANVDLSNFGLPIAIAIKSRDGKITTYTREEKTIAERKE